MPELLSEGGGSFRAASSFGEISIMRAYRLFPFSWLAGAAVAIFIFAGAHGHAAGDTEAKRVPPPPLSKEALRDPKVIGTGEELWKDQCAHCHGSRAYPGKAPRLQPRRYKAEFVWDRIYNGFRGMPSWKDVYTDDEVVAIVAYVMSDDFFP